MDTHHIVEIFFSWVKQLLNLGWAISVTEPVMQCLLS